LSAEEELLVSEAEKPKTTRSRVTRTRRKPAEAAVTEESTTATAGDSDNGAAPTPAEPMPPVATPVESPPSPAPEIAQSVDAPLPAPAADLTETAASVTATPNPESDTSPSEPATAHAEPVAMHTEPVALQAEPMAPQQPAREHPTGMNGDRPRRDRGNRPDRPMRGERPERAHDGEQGDGFQPQRGQQPRDGRDGHQRNRPERRPSGPQLSVAELEAKTNEELFETAKGFELQGFTRMKRPDLINRLLQAQTERDGNIFGDGILEINEDGFGFLRGQRLLPSHDDIYVSQSQIRRFGLRTGDRVSGQVRPPKDNEKFFSLLRVEAVNGVDPETARRRPAFDTLTPIFPLEMIDLETQPNILSTRLLNLVAPIGRGQRGLIVSPPKAGKTLLLKSIANGITTNNPDMHLMVCLIGERPEEVTDMKRSVEGEVISSTFDEPVEDHTKVAEMALERAKRLVEAGRHVTILLDSITRLARAYNLAVPPSGRTLSGGIDPVALYPPKRFFGAARNIEGGGSLTIVATCLVDTGSRMDDVIYEEFKGTGNMELHLDRKLAERRIYPAIDIQRSGTRREELLLDEPSLRQVWTMRRMVSMLGGSEGTELMLGRLSKTSSNAEFLATLSKDL
jgi:transcription termination factor Rho